jgi:hypothetical protein
MRREAPGHMKQGDQKGALEVLLLSFIVRSFYRQRGVSDSSENFGHLYLVSGSCDNTRGLF